MRAAHMTATLPNAIPGQTSRGQGTSSQRPPHGLTVFGWVVAILASVPMIMGAPGQGPPYFLLAGGLMLGAGLVMIAIGRRIGGPDQS